MLPDLLSSPLFGHIRRYFEDYDSKRHTVFVFAPYIKAEVLARLADGINSRMVIVTSWKPQDVASGTSDLDLYPYCKEHEVPLYINNRLHLKIYSIGLDSAILATGNVSRRGMMEGGNYEMGILVPSMTSTDRLYLEQIRAEARLADDAMYEALKRWSDTNKATPQEDVRLEDVIPVPERDDFLISALPMTRHVDDLVEGYVNVQEGRPPSEDRETSNCVFHDLTNYGIGQGLDRDQFVEALKEAFFAHPFIQRIDGFIDPEAYFGRIKEWIQGNCTDVPVPSRRELTGNVQVLLEWFEKLSDGKYTIDVPGARSQRIKNLTKI